LAIFEQAIVAIAEKASSNASSSTALTGSPSQSGAALTSSIATAAHSLFFSSTGSSPVSAQQVANRLLWKKTKLLRGLGRLFEYLDIDSGFPKIFRCV
jgi:hypothetical protein